MYPLLVVKIISQQLKNTNQGVWLQIIKNVCKLMCNRYLPHDPNTNFQSLLFTFLRPATRHKVGQRV